MIQINPSNADVHPHHLLLQKVAEALGYDLQKIDAGEDPGGKCPCCQIDALMDLILEEHARLYRKGWDHVIDGETPPVPDLLFTQPPALNLGELERKTKKPRSKRSRKKS